jgi:hypothetical protein
MKVDAMPRLSRLVPVASGVGAVLGWLFAHFMVQATPAILVLLCAGTAMIAGYLWQWVTGK